jgi:N-acyl-D-amino-acid deacylase
MRAGLLLLLAAVCSQAAEYDILIRNARVVDGTGNPWFRADVAIRDGRIAAVGRLEGARAYRVIDAAGRVLAPGFIDVHTHSESIDRIPRADNFLLDGVTTLITGNCGGSRVDLAGWFTQLEKTGLGPNLGSLIGHNSVRREVMGTANRQAADDEIARMQALVEKAMSDGAVGFSTGLIYIPGTYANSAEVISLAKAAAKYGGVYASHMRDEGEQVLESIEEAITIGREAGMPVQLSHFKIDNRKLWGSSDKSIALVEKARREGVDVVVDQYPYDRSSTNLGILLPSWALADGDEKIKERFNDPATRSKIAAETIARARTRGLTDFGYAMVANFAYDQSFNGKTIAEINQIKGRPDTFEAQAETVLDMLSQGGAQMIYHSMSEEDVERILRYPNTAIASDSGVIEFGKAMPHPRGYGSNARVLAEFVRNRGVLTLEDAIRRMTSLPARTFGLLDRGVVREGFAADLVLFDPARVQDKSTYAQPHQYSEGFDLVLVNGRIAVEDGKSNSVLAGKVLRRR